MKRLKNETAQKNETAKKMTFVFFFVFFKCFVIVRDLIDIFVR